MLAVFCSKTNIALINPKLAHLVDYIFWTLGFKSGEQCDKDYTFSAFSLLIIILCRQAVLFHWPHGNSGVLILLRP